MSTIPIQGLAADDYVPGLYAQASFGAGDPSGFAGVDAILIVGNRTSSGTATVDSVVYGPDTSPQMANETDCKTLFGPGSEVHRMYRRITMANQSTPIYAIAVTESAGTAASKMFIFQTTATAAGTVRIWVGDEFVEVGFISGDTPAVFVAAADDVINRKTHWAQTAAGTTVGVNGELLFTAKLKGPRGNRLRTAIEIRPTTAGLTVFTADYKTTIAAGSDGASLPQATINVASAASFPSSGTIYVTTAAVGLQAVTYSGKTGTSFTGCSGGTGAMATGGAVYSAASGHDYLTAGATADSNTSALSAIANRHFFYQLSAANDATQLGAHAAQIATQHLPINNNRQSLYAGFNDTVANAITLATGINNAAVEIPTLPDSDAPPEELAAAALAVYALGEAPAIPRLNFNFYGQQPDEQALWTIKAPRNGAVPTRAQEVSMLNNGVTPIRPVSGGRTIILGAITTLSVIGGQQNHEVRPRSKRVVTIRYTRDLQTVLASATAGKNIGNDPEGQEPSPPNAFTPREMKAITNTMTRDYGADGLIERVAETILATQAIRESNPTDRMSVRVPLHVVDIFNQGALLVEQIS
jgi:phage tail sheath gpL-like